MYGKYRETVVYLDVTNSRCRGRYKNITRDFCITATQLHETTVDWYSVRCHYYQQLCNQKSDLTIMHMLQVYLQIAVTTYCCIFLTPIYAISVSIEVCIFLFIDCCSKYLLTTLSPSIGLELGSNGIDYMISLI
jgi:hypothetical protein